MRSMEEEPREDDSWSMLKRYGIPAVLVWWIVNVAALQ